MKKIIVFSMLAILLIAAGYSYVQAADTGHLFADSAVNDAAVGTTDWLNPTNALTDNGSTDTTCGCRVSGGVTDWIVRLNKSGTPLGGDNKSLGTTFTTGVRTYGGAADAWSLALTPTDINDTTFGVGISFVGNGGISKYLLVTDFDFAIPAGATINGIEVALDVINAAGNPSVDYVSMKVYYTEAVAPAATGAVRAGSVQVRTGQVNVR